MNKLVFIDMKITAELDEETTVACAVGVAQEAILRDLENCFISNVYVEAPFKDSKNSKTESKKH